MIVPTYNERDNIVPLLDQVRAALAGRAFDVLVVDDDSPDETWRVAEAYGAVHPEVTVLRRRGVRGLSGAVVDGFARARGAALAVLDADLSHDPALLPVLVDAVESGADVAVGSRRVPGGGADVWPWFRRLASSVATHLARRVLGVRLADPMSGYFALRREVFEAVRGRVATRGYKVLLEVVARAEPCAIVELPYVFRDRRQGVSKVSLPVLLAYLSSLWKLRREIRGRHAVAPPSPSAPAAPSWRAAGAVIVLAAVYVATRYRLATTPALAETSYDEALTGLMGFAILRGEPQVFYWGQPYLGAIEGYVAALGFWVAGASALTLRMAEILAAFAWVWSVWSLTRRIAGESWGFVAGLAVALPPVFLSFAQLSAHGQSLSVTLGAVVLATAATLLDPRRGSGEGWMAWIILGLAAGLGWWASQMVTMFLAAAALVIVAVRPRVLRTMHPYIALGCFAVASLPFWVWNLRHEWATIRHLLSWGDPLPPEWSVRFEAVADTLLRTLRGQFWDSREIQMPRSIAGLGWLSIVTFYLPGVLIAVARLGRWVARAWRRQRPWQEPLDLITLAFWLTVAAHAVTWFGTSGILRYAMTFYATLPVLSAAALARVARRRRALMGATVTVVVVMVVYQAATHVLFVRGAAAEPWRPVDGAIAVLTRVGARGCYADSRIAQVITFESGERFVCADYVGLRNYAFLQAVDAIEDPDGVAIVTHRRLENPPPRVMTAALHRVGAEWRVDRVGDYEILHHFRPPGTPLRPLAPEAWRATASTHPEQAELAFDRKVWTRWNARYPRGAWLQVDLGSVHRIAGLTLLAEPLGGEAPGSLRIEASLDGRIWDLVDEDRTLLSGIHWWKGHPRLDESGRVVVRMTPHPARYVRFLHLDNPPRGGEWSLAELFVYEEADRNWTPPPAAVAALDEARGVLRHWMDDPGGPHPRRAPVTYAHRRAQVSWAAVFAAANRAIEAAPAWEEAHELYGSALDLSRWDQRPDLAVKQAWEDRAWEEVLRWAEIAEAGRPVLWRSGRVTAQADALEGLGRPAEAAAVRAVVAGRPPPSFHLAFGREVELVAVDVPASVRRGETLRIGWTWRALRPIDRDYVAVLHLNREARAGRTTQARSLGGSFPTSAWAPGERVEEGVSLPLPLDLAPGVYGLHVAVGWPGTTRRLGLDAHGRPGAGRYTARIATLTVAP